MCAEMRAPNQTKPAKAFRDRALLPMFAILLRHDRARYGYIDINEILPISIGWRSSVRLGRVGGRARRHRTNLAYTSRRGRRRHGKPAHPQDRSHSPGASRFTASSAAFEDRLHWTKLSRACGRIRTRSAQRTSAFSEGNFGVACAW